jgi:subtilisin-like proprotein convertase family protein
MRNQRNDARQAGRRFLGTAGALAVLSTFLMWTATPAAATVFSNTAAITIPSSGQGTPYPSTIAVPASGAVADVNVTLTGFAHQIAYDVDVLLVGPTGKNVVLMADNGNATAVTNQNLTFDDAATASLPAAGTAPIATGTYKPSNGGAFNGTAPAPAAPYGATLSVFNGTDPSGNWNLFVFDDLGGATGSVAGGWSLDITLASLSSFSPASGKVGDPVVLTGVGFTGATTVKFGNTVASTFTVDSDTQITATVPPGAGTGPIAVTTPTLGVLTGAADFIVNHVRNVSITLNGKKAKGDANVKDGFTKCGSNVPVKIQHLEKGKWKTVAGVLTKANGSYKAGGLDDKGKYRAVVKKVTLSSGDVCLRDISPIAKK